MAIIINDNLTTFSPKSLDSRYGPWTGLTHANTNVIASVRYSGLTVGISTGVSITEYWYASGTTDSDLVLKTVAGTGGGISDIRH